MEQNFIQNVDTLFSNMENFTQKEGVIGKAVTHGDKTFLPIVSVTLGYGGGNSQTNNQTHQQATQQANQQKNNHMGGGALGFGAKLSTDAVIVIDKQNVMISPLSSSGGMNQLIEKVPQIVSSMSSGGQGGTQGAQGGQQQQQQQKSQ